MIDNFNMRLIVCGDDDHATEGNLGRTKATEAARAVGGLLALPIFPEGTNGTDFNDLAVAVGLDAVRQQIQAATTPREVNTRGELNENGTSNRQLKFVDIREAIESPREQAWLVDGLIEDQTTGAVFGASTAGKSFIAIDLAAAVATGQQWHGGKIVRSGTVLYFAGEGRHGIPRRVKAWQDYHGVMIPPGKFLLPSNRVEFNRVGVAEVIGAIEKLEEPPALIVVDTVARSLPSGADENSALHMMEFINQIDGIRDQFGCTVVLVHHTGHGQDSQNRARGSSAFRAAMDWELLVDKSKSCTVWTKQKDSELPPGLSFELVQVGESAVVEYAEAAHCRPRLSRNDQLGVDTLTESCQRLKRPWVTIDEWRQDFYRRHHGDTPGDKRKPFERARKSLLYKELIIVVDDTYGLSGTEQNVPDMSWMSRDERDTPLKSVPVVPHREVQEVDW